MFCTGNKKPQRERTRNSCRGTGINVLLIRFAEEAGGKYPMTTYLSEKLGYAADMAHNLAVSYRRCALAAPLLLLILTLVTGLASGSWWHVIIYGAVFLISYPKWKNKERQYLDAEAEIRKSAENGEEELSETAKSVYDECSASPKALWFGIISLGIVSATCFVLGMLNVKLAYYIPPNVPEHKVPDVSMLLIGLFLMLMGLIPLVPVVQWAVLLPSATKLSKQENA